METTTRILGATITDETRDALVETLQQGAWIIAERNAATGRQFADSLDLLVLQVRRERPNSVAAIRAAEALLSLLRSRVAFVLTGAPAGTLPSQKRAALRQSERDVASAMIVALVKDALTR